MNKTFLLLAATLFSLITYSQNSAQNSLLTDTRDGTTYKTINIGRNIWMAENLNFVTENSWCYSNADSLCRQYGRLYSWNAALNACPVGWHLPSDTEWNALIETLGVAHAQLNIVGYQCDTITKQLNAVGFNILQAGYRLWWDGSFHYLGVYADFWTSTDSDNDEAWSRNFSANDYSVYRNRINKKYGYSVRCIKD